MAREPKQPEIRRLACALGVKPPPSPDEIVTQVQNALIGEFRRLHQRLVTSLVHHARLRRQSGDDDTAASIVDYLMRLDACYDEMARHLGSKESYDEHLGHVRRQLDTASRPKGGSAASQVAAAARSWNPAARLLSMPDSEFDGFVAQLVASHFAVPRPDGPVEPLSFAWDGVVFPGMRPMAWKAVSHVWQARRRCADVSDMAEPVWGDRVDVPTDDEVGSVRRDANRFFRKHNIGLELIRKGTIVSLRRKTLSPDNGLTRANPAAKAVKLLTAACTLLHSPDRSVGRRTPK
jgi:hypothetical protein